MTSDLKCLRCRYTWKRRTWNRLPRQCPNCHRNDWNKPEVGPVGRPPLKPKEVMPSETAPIRSKSDASEEHRAEMSTSAKPAESEPMESMKVKGEVEAIVRKRLDDAVAHLVSGGGLQHDTSTDDLLNHLLEQMEREDI